MSERRVLCEFRDGVAWAVLNRPDKLNAMDLELRKELLQCLQEAESREDVRVVVIRGSGKAFSAGADISYLKMLSEMSLADFDKLKGFGITDIGLFIRGMSKPVIAVVHGYCVGGGTQLLPRLIGEKRAKEAIFTARRITAQEAKEWGLVNEVCPPEKIDECVNKVIEEIKQRSPVAIALAKRAINAALELPLSKGLEYEALMFQRALMSEDGKEGLRAFLEKRKPVYKGR